MGSICRPALPVMMASGPDRFGQCLTFGLGLFWLGLAVCILLLALQRKSIARPHGGAAASAALSLRYVSIETMKIVNGLAGDYSPVRHVRAGRLALLFGGSALCQADRRLGLWRCDGRVVGEGPDGRGRASNVEHGLGVKQDWSTCFVAVANGLRVGYSPVRHVRAGRHALLFGGSVKRQL